MKETHVVENASFQFFLRAQVLATNLSSMPRAQHDRLIHKRLFHNLVFKCSGEYFQTTSVLASFSLAPTSFDTILTFIVLHPKTNSFFLFFLENYEPNQDLKLSSYYFKLTFQHMPNLSISGP
jgi:hypothetical protein